MFGFSSEILCEVCAFLSLLPAYPIWKVVVCRWFAIVLIVVKWSMSLFSSSHQRKPRASGGRLQVAGCSSIEGCINSSEILHIHFSPISSTMKSSVLCFSLAGIFCMEFLGEMSF